MRDRWVGLLGVALLALMGGAPAAWAGLTLKGPPRIAFLVPGGVADDGEMQAIDRARKALETQFEQRIPLTEHVAPEAAATAVEALIHGGANVIVGGAAGYGAAFAAEAAAHPDLAFIDLSGAATAPNLESPNVTTYEAWYLAGVAAGNATQSKMIGIVASLPRGASLCDVNAFALGARLDSHRIVVLASFAGSAAPVGTPGRLADAMLGQGADLVAGDVAVPGPVLAAEAAGHMSIGYPGDMTATAPKGMLTSVVVDWSAVLSPLLRRIAAGDWTSPGVTFHGIKDAAVDITRPGPAVQPMQLLQLAKLRQAIIDGSFAPFTGPIRAHGGALKYAEGQVVPPAEALRMDFLVDNVRGSLK